MDGDNAIQALAQYTDDYLAADFVKVRRFNGTATSSGGGHIAIPHGFGVAPTGAVVTLHGVTGSPRVCFITSLDATNITAQCYNPATDVTINNTPIQYSAIAWTGPKP
jgi:hypothetical protein